MPRNINSVGCDWLGSVGQHNIIITFCDKRVLCFTGIFFLWQDRNVLLIKGTLTSDANFLPVPWIFLLWYNCSWVLFLIHEFFSCDRKFLPALKNFFLWQRIFSCDGKFLLELQLCSKSSHHVAKGPFKYPGTTDSPGISMMFG